jgi:hypothetical protein
VQLIDPDLPVSNIRTQQQQIDASIQQEKMFASLLPVSASTLLLIRPGRD